MCARVFPTHPPAGTTAVVASLTSPDALIEIEACARLGQNTKWLDAADRPIFYGRENRQHHLYLGTNGGKVGRAMNLQPTSPPSSTPSTKTLMPLSPSSEQALVTS